MISLWYGVVAAMVATYVVLDGFDLGAGLLHRFIARTEDERRQVLAAIGPFWDGNEVWLLAGGGTLFFAFPQAYAVGFSGFYLPLTMVLWLLILRGLSIELRHREESPLWTVFWDTTLSFSSGLLSIVLGAALGNVVRGVPIDQSGFFAISLFNTRGPGILDGYTVLLGVFTLVLLATHGALFLAWKTEGRLMDRSRRVGKTCGAASALLFVGVTLATRGVQPQLLASLPDRPLAMGLASFAVASMGVLAWSMLSNRDRLAFLGSCATLVGLLATAAALQFPVLLPSTLNPAFSITAELAASGGAGMSAGLHWWPLALIFALAYWSYLFHSFRGKVTVGTGH